MISEQESIVSQQCSYELDEVVWGKIRGYPYWPGYVKTVQLPDFLNKQAEKRLITIEIPSCLFRGQHSNSSLLTKSKIRKYYQSYHQMYAQGRKHKKLGSAIKLAQQRLVQNNEDIKIFKQIRDQIDKESSQKKKKPGRPRIYSSMACSQQYQQFQSVQKKIQVSQQKYQSEQKQKQQISVKKVMVNQLNERQLIVNQQQQQLKPTKRRPGRPKGWRKPGPAKQQASSQQNSQIQQKEISSEQKSQKQLQQQNKTRKIRKMRSRISTDKAIAQKRTQNDIRNSNLPTSESQLHKQKTVFDNSDSDILIPPINQKFKPCMQNLSPQQKLFIEKIQFSLKRQNELIESIINCENITMNILQYLLDRSVPQIIQKGSPSLDGYKVLQLLQVMVTMKYFPEDKKNCKKYQALVKSKKKQSASTSQSKHEEEIGSDLHGDLQIRRKTVNKLEKIMRIKSGESSKQYAIQIESWFREHDKSIGQTYKTIAYKTMRNLKDQPDQLTNILTQIIGSSNVNQQ